MRDQHTKLAALRAADYRSFRDFDLNDQERRRDERERYACRRAKAAIREALLNGRMH